MGAIEVVSQGFYPGRAYTISGNWLITGAWVFSGSGSVLFAGTPVFNGSVTTPSGLGSFQFSSRHSYLGGPGSPPDGFIFDLVPAAGTNSSHSVWRNASATELMKLGTTGQLQAKNSSATLELVAMPGNNITWSGTQLFNNTTQFSAASTTWNGTTFTFSAGGGNVAASVSLWTWGNNCNVVFSERNFTPAAPGASKKTLYLENSTLRMRTFDNSSVARDIENTYIFSDNNTWTGNNTISSGTWTHASGTTETWQSGSTVNFDGTTSFTTGTKTSTSTWNITSGTWTWATKTVHNGGLDIGTGTTDGSGVAGFFDSHVPDAVSNTNYVFQPTTTMDPTDSSRHLFDIRNSSGASKMVIFGDGGVAFGGSGTVGGFINYIGTVPNSGGGLGFNMLASFPNSATILGLTNIICGSYLNPRPTSASTGTSWLATVAEATSGGATWQTITATIAGFVFRNTLSFGTSIAIANQHGVYIKGGVSKRTVMVTPVVTNMHGFYMEDYATSGASGTFSHTNIYGVRIVEQTGAGTLNVGILVEQGTTATAAYKGICLRDTTAWLSSSAAGVMDINATTINMNAGGNTEWAFAANTSTLREAHNIVVGTTTGTKIGTATTQKLGFFNATPVVRPAAYTPTNVTTDRSYDANSTTLDEVADVLGTLIADLQSLGLVG